MQILEKRDVHLEKKKPMEVRCTNCESRLLVEHSEWVFGIYNLKRIHYVSCANCQFPIQKPIKKGGMLCA